MVLNPVSRWGLVVITVRQEGVSPPAVPEDFGPVKEPSAIRRGKTKGKRRERQGLQGR